MPQEAQRGLLRDERRAALPVLAAFDQQRVARVGGIVELRIVAQAPSGAMTGVDDDVLRHAERAREVAAPSRAVPASASAGHGSVIECRSSRKSVAS